MWNLMAAGAMVVLGVMALVDGLICWLSTWVSILREDLMAGLLRLRNGYQLVNQSICYSIVEWHGHGEEGLSLRWHWRIKHIGILLWPYAIGLWCLLYVQHRR